MTPGNLMLQPRWHRLICILNHRGSWVAIRRPTLYGRDSVATHETGCSRCSTIWCSHLRAHYYKEYWER